MKKYLLLPIFAAGVAFAQGSNPFLGRWDLMVTSPRNSVPDWLEVTRSGGALAARYQPSGGASRPIQQVTLDGSRLILTLGPAANNRPAQTWELTVSGDKIGGVQKNGETESAKLEGVRAPALQRAAPKAWSAPEPLFNGKDLTGWEPLNPANNKWTAQNGELVNPERGSNIRTSRKFDDFKLHVELLCSEEHCNSGVYLRGRYEIQMGTEGGTQPSHEQGAVYGMAAPSPALPLGIGQWQVFDITLVGRNVTVVQNGTKIHDNVEIPGFTGGALDANEGEPGPFFLQGDHGPVKYRNITVSVPR
ncbi:MAG: DUF1080 domain-containing protein [Acidobacteriia bacterium]|nr:DUF1080 domain-containing protein [Terriglobia bacterium]